MTTKSNSSEAARQARAVIERYDRFDQVLRATHDTIPARLAEERKLSAEIGSIEIAGGDPAPARAKLAAVIGERQNEARRRAAAAASLIELEAALMAAYDGVNTEKQAQAGEVTRAFLGRYRAAVEALEALWREGETLGRALGVSLPMPLPPRPAALQPSAEPLNLPQPVKETLDVFERLKGALTICLAVRNGQELDKRFTRLAVMRGQTTEFQGTYSVIRRFSCPTDGQQFAEGVLIDHSLVGAGFLARLNTMGSVRLAAGA